MIAGHERVTEPQNDGDPTARHFTASHRVARPLLVAHVAADGATGRPISGAHRCFVHGDVGLPPGQDDSRRHPSSVARPRSERDGGSDGLRHNTVVE